MTRVGFPFVRADYSQEEFDFFSFPLLLSPLAFRIFLVNGETRKRVPDRWEGSRKKSLSCEIQFQARASGTDVDGWFGRALVRRARASDRPVKKGWEEKGKLPTWKQKKHRKKERERERERKLSTRVGATLDLGGEKKKKREEKRKKHVELAVRRVQCGDDRVCIVVRSY